MCSFFEIHTKSTFKYFCGETSHDSHHQQYLAGNAVMRGEAYHGVLKFLHLAGNMGFTVPHGIKCLLQHFVKRPT